MGSPAIFKGSRVQLLNSEGFEFQNGRTFLWGSGNPEGSVIAINSSLYINEDDPSTIWLKETGTGNTGWVQLGGGSGVPGGNNTNIQFNDSGAFGGSDAFIWDGTKMVISLANSGTSDYANTTIITETNGDNYVQLKLGDDAAGGIIIGDVDINDYFKIWGSINNGELYIQTNGVGLQIGESGNAMRTIGYTDYETLVVDDDDIPNKKYVDDVMKLYELVLIRSDYGSDVDAGNALVTAVNSGSYDTIWVDEGTWNIGTQTISLGGVREFKGASKQNTTIVSTKNSGATFTSMDRILLQDFTLVNAQPIPSAYSMISFNPFYPTIVRNVFLSKGTGSFMPNKVCFDGLGGSPYVRIINCESDGAGVFAEDIHGEITGCYATEVGQTILDNCKNVTNFTFDEIVTGFSATYKLFNTCENLTNIRHYETGTKTPAGSFAVFSQCDNVTNYKFDEIGGYSTGGAGQAVYFFIMCNNVVNPYISTGRLTSSNSVVRLFDNCHGVSNFNITTSFEYGNIESSVFYDCKGVSNGYVEITDDQPVGQVQPVIRGLTANNTSATTNKNYSNIDINFDPILNAGSTDVVDTVEQISNITVYIGTTLAGNSHTAFQDCRGVSNCSAIGNTSKNFFHGFDNCANVIGCHATRCQTRSYNSTTGYANTYFNATAGAGNTALAAFETNLDRV